MSELDVYGGFTGIATEATGFFRIERIDDRWWLIDPEGHAFLSVGMNHFDLHALKHHDNIHVWRDRYGADTDTYIREGISKPLREWGFNTIGWSQECVGGRWKDPKANLRHSHGWTHEQFRTAGLPYVYNFVFGDMEHFNMKPEYPDVDGEVFDEWIDYQARSACVDMADDPLLVGYADLPQPDFLRKAPGSWAENLDLEKDEDVAELKRIVSTYFQKTVAAIRRHDPNHLILGPRFFPQPPPPDTPEWVIQLAGKHFDLILVNNHVRLDQIDTEIARWHEISGKPILFSDMLYLAPTRLLHIDPGGPTYMPDQAARGDAYAHFCETVFARPWCIGVHWCAYLENRTRKSGVRNWLDEPYDDCVSRMAAFNGRVYEVARGGRA